MARYTGPRDKISRRFGVPLFGPSKALERRAYAPGMHGGKRGGRRSKGSDYSEALAEKQKLTFSILGPGKSAKFPLFSKIFVDFLRFS